MYPRSIIHSGCVLLLIAASSESRRNYMNNDEQRGNSMVRSDFSVNSTENRDDKMQSTLNNSIKIDDETNLKKDIYNESMSITKDICNAKINILKMYPSGLIHRCYIIQEKNMNDEQNDESMTQYPLLINFMKDRDNRTGAYNLDNVLKENQMKYNTSVNIYISIPTKNTKIEIFLEYSIYASILVALMCLLLTFVVYTILPEFQNIHGYTLRVHVVLLFIVNVIKICINKFHQFKYCSLLVFIYNFSAMSSLFWLNVICFDIWWTFRKVRSYQTNVKNREKKKFIKYSIYAWGITFILNVISVLIMIYAGDLTWNDLSAMCDSTFILQSLAMMLSFSIPVGVIVIVNICFFILTIQTILHHDRHIAKDLADLESNRYYKIKRKFSTYLKLFMVMGISWIMEIVSLCLTVVNKIFIPTTRNISYMIFILQSFIIFMIYVWQKRIMQLLLKRFDWRDRNPGKVSNSNDCPNTVSNTTSISETVPMQNISLSNQQINHCAESYF